MMRYRLFDVIFLAGLAAAFVFRSARERADTNCGAVLRSADHCPKRTYRVAKEIKIQARFKVSNRAAVARCEACTPDRNGAGHARCTLGSQSECERENSRPFKLRTPLRLPE